MNDLYYDVDTEDIPFFDNSEDIDFYDEDIGDYDDYGENIDDVGDEYLDEDYFSEDPEMVEEFWEEPDDLEAIEMAEAESYLPEAFEPEFLAEYEPDMFDDSAELAEALREALHEDYQDATPEEMQEALFEILESMPPAEAFNFKKILRQISKAGRKVLRDPTVGKIAKTVLPAAGTAIGTIYGGPAGAAIGGKLGQVAGKAFSGKRKRRTRPARPRVVKSSAKGGSAAATQLLQLTQNPDMLKSLLALALGSQGRKSVKAGERGPAVPVGGFVNLLNTLVQQAASDADELLRENDEAVAYLLDGEGEYLADPWDPQARAEVLYETLSAAENQRQMESADDDLGWEAYYSEDPEAAEARNPFWYYRSRRARARAMARARQRARSGYGRRFRRMARYPY